MAYKKLSDLVKEVVNAQRTDTFIKRFREAVRSGEIDAAYVGERFTMPKSFSRRQGEGTYQKEAREMIFAVTPKFEKWFAETNKELASGRRGSALKASQANIEAGLVDFRALAAATRQKMQASYDKGQALGLSRQGQRAGGKKTGRVSTRTKQPKATTAPKSGRAK